MLDAIRKAGRELNEETFEFPDYMSAFYFIGDGGDTCGNKANIKNFLGDSDSTAGFGEHIVSATMLGNERQRAELAEIFGDEKTSVAPDFNTLLKKSMEQFDDDISYYMEGKVV